ncbi:MAG: class I SAM-dependent methyltransferase, partial [Bacteroidota bacterium]
MKLSDEYQAQRQWRNWEAYLAQLPIKPNDLILDLGCGTGDVAALLAQQAKRVIAIDGSTDVLDFARQRHTADNIIWERGNLQNLSEALSPQPQVNGIWASFSPAYFPDFLPVLQHWCSFLCPGGWIALTEIDHLFGHRPMAQHFQSAFQAFYQQSQAGNLYDFEMGHQLADFLRKAGLEIEWERKVVDPELSADGPVSLPVYTAWRKRLERMQSLRDFFGNNYDEMKQAFLAALQDETHRQTC